jgi:hypothetical protein
MAEEESPESKYCYIHQHITAYSLKVGIKY